MMKHSHEKSQQVSITVIREDLWRQYVTIEKYVPRSELPVSMKELLDMAYEVEPEVIARLNMHAYEERGPINPMAALYTFAFKAMHAQGKKRYGFAFICEVALTKTVASEEEIMGVIMFLLRYYAFSPLWPCDWDEEMSLEEFSRRCRIDSN